MRYKVMRLMCMFDLPVVLEKEKKEYIRFRKNLLKFGFVMIQYSVYMRTCPSREYANRIKERIRKACPPRGHIRIMMITEKQYEDMQIIIGSKSTTEQKIGMERLIVI